MELNKLNIPTEVIELPSKGLLYSEDNILAKGTIEMCYMTAKHEDILTNANLIKQGTVLDKLLEALVVTKINHDDLTLGDKNAILVAARILGYGKKYQFEYSNPYNSKEKIPIEIDLTQLEETQPDPELFQPGKNEFNYHLPIADIDITFKILTQRDEKEIEKDIKGLKKLFPLDSFTVTTNLKHTILSVGGDSEPKIIREFVDYKLRAQDIKDLRKYIVSISPDVKFVFEYDFGKGSEEVNIPMEINFFGLNNEYRVWMFEQIDEIVVNGGGGYDWNTVYNMPVWLRKFTYHRLAERFKKQNDKTQSLEEQMSNVDKPTQVTPPSFVYNPKASTK